MSRIADWRPRERVHAVFSPTAALRHGDKLMAADKPGRASSSMRVLPVPG
jgi:hypothetical protein